MLGKNIFLNHETASLGHYWFRLLFGTNEMKKVFYFTKKLYCFLKDEKNLNLNKIDNVVNLFSWKNRKKC